MTKKKNLSALTGLRFFAAFYVFIFHMYIRVEEKVPSKSLDLVLSNGALGVNIFFVLSGLILFYNYYDRKIHWGEFMLKRLAKIYPIYFLGLILCIAVVYITQTPVKNFAEIVALNISLLQSYIPYDNSFNHFSIFIFILIGILIFSGSDITRILCISLIFILNEILNLNITKSEAKALKISSIIAVVLKFPLLILQFNDNMTIGQGFFITQPEYIDSLTLLFTYIAIGILSIFVFLYFNKKNI